MTPHHASGTVTPASVLSLAQARPPTLGRGRLVCVDGPSGSGKTTLAEGIAALRPGTPVVHMDDLYQGWDGLAGVADQLDGLLRPLAGGVAGRYRRWDWVAGDWAETHLVEPGPLLVLEGVGSGSPGTADLITVLVWVEAAYDDRMARGIARDGAAYEPHWHRWAEQEAALFAEHDTRARSDLVLRT
ncbi:AAA family ATPase [Nocardioides bigeumensis]|uniref:AAA family ATPase n=1 Tax=Nocardioides bigeumensis TaxID=433657 RepID=A0ABP5JVH3_9ACTN